VSDGTLAGRPVLITGAAPGWVAPVLPLRMTAQRIVELATRASIERVLEVARAERAPLSTSQPPRRISDRYR
jgi:hypothetical protein